MSLPENFNWSDLSEVASWYLQGGFGAPMATLQSTLAAYGRDIGRWIRDQQSLTPTLSRSYFRKRNNPRPEPISDVDHPKVPPSSTVM